MWTLTQGYWKSLIDGEGFSIAFVIGRTKNIGWWKTTVNKNKIINIFLCDFRRQSPDKYNAPVTQFVALKMQIIIH